MKVDTGYRMCSPQFLAQREGLIDELRVRIQALEAERDAAHKKNKLLRSVLMTALLHIDDGNPNVAAALRARLAAGGE